MTLNCSKVSLDSGTNLSAEPNPSSNSATKGVFNTFENDTFTVPFLIDVTNSSERDILKNIAVLHKTQGVKLLYSSDTATTIKMLPEIIGRTDTKFQTSSIGGVDLSAIPIIVCRAIGVHIDNIASSRKYTITGTITFKEEKVVPA